MVYQLLVASKLAFSISFFFLEVLKSQKMKNKMTEWLNTFLLKNDSLIRLELESVDASSFFLLSECAIQKSHMESSRFIQICSHDFIIFKLYESYHMNHI